MLYGFAHRGGAAAVSQPHQGLGRGTEDRAGAALRDQRGGLLPVRAAAKTSAALTRVPGIGRKTAERLIVEMRDRLAAPAASRRRRRRGGRGERGERGLRCARGARLPSGRGHALAQSGRSRYTLHRGTDPPRAAGRGAGVEPLSRDSRAHHQRHGERGRRGGRARHPPAPPGGVRRPGARQGAAGDLHQRRARARRGARSRPDLRPAGSGQDDAGAHHRRRARREPAPDLRSGARAPRGSGGAAHQPAGARRAVHRRDSSPVAGRGGGAVPGAWRIISSTS